MINKLIKKIRKHLLRLIDPNKYIRPTYADKYVQVFSHPRSGTHFIESFLAENFYSGHCFEPKTGKWGHWANRIPNPGTNIHHKLFGGHYFPKKAFKKINYPSIYIYRDGRSVAYSIWKTENFIHPKYKNITFSDFLRLKLDWIGSSGTRSKPRYTIAEHWEKHVDGWLNISKGNEHILLIRYEELKDQPYETYVKIHDKFFSDQPLKSFEEINTIQNPIGLKPNKGTKDSWKKIFSEDDLQFFKSQISKKELLTNFE